MTQASAYQFWFSELRQGINVDANFLRLKNWLIKSSRRRFYVRVLLHMARHAQSPEQKVLYAEEAADILFGFLNKPWCACLVYQYVDSTSAGALTVERVIQELSLEHGRRVERADPILAKLVRLLRDESASTEELLHKKRQQIADLFISDRPDLLRLQNRTRSIKKWIERDGQLRDEIIGVLRSRERFDAVVSVLRTCLAFSSDEARIRVLLDLGHALRFGLANLSEAADSFEQIVTLAPHHRQAWGELLECLDDSGDIERLLRMLQRRVVLTQGLEREQLIRRLASLGGASPSL